jgi:hypothetical protein
MRRMTRVPTAPLAAAGLIAGFGVAVGTGSRPFGGVVLLVFGCVCVVVWLQRDGARVAALLTGAGLLAFALSHVLGLVIGAWPAVLVVAGAMAALCWRASDSRLFVRARRRDVGVEPEQVVGVPAPLDLP